MLDSLSRELDDHKSRQRSSAGEQLAAPDSVGGTAPVVAFYQERFLRNPRLGGRGNLDMHSSLMQQAQQTHGNRAVQRSMPTLSGRASSLSVQRTWLDDATDWVGDRASNVMEHPVESLTDVASYLPIPGNPLATMRAGHDINQLFGAGHDAQGNSTPSRFGQGVDWVEGGISGVTHSLADRVSDVPIVGSVAGAGARAIDFTTQVSGGAWKAAGDMVGGIGGMLEHPLDAAMGLERVAENLGPGPVGVNPFRMAHGAYDVASGNRSVLDAAHHWLDPVEAMRQSNEFSISMLMGQQGRDGERHGGLIEGYRDAWDQGKYGEIVGRAGVDIGSFFIGAGEARGAAEVGNVVRGVEGAEAAAAATRGLEGANATCAAVEGTEAIRAVEGVEGARGATTPMPLKHSPTPPAPGGAGEWEEITEVTQAPEMATLSEQSGAASQLSQAPVGEVPAPIEFGPGPADAGKAPLPTDEFAAFKQLAQGDTRLLDAPGKLTLPQELNEGMQKAMKESFPGGVSQEQGGIITQGADGSFRWKQGQPGNSGSFTPNFRDVGPNEKLAGSMHTHPYDASEGGLTDVSFSSEDISSIIRTDEPVQFVQSGETQFGSARTQEFNDRLQGLDDAGKTKLAQEMDSHYGSVLDSLKDTGLSFQEKIEAAVKAVHDEFDLLYYRGKEGVLTRQ